jgi:NAD+ diphosphatase
MHFTYCPQCREKLQSRPTGDEGLVPYCNTCKRYWFDWFYSCSIILVCNEYDEVVLCKQPHLSKEYESITSGFIKPGETAEETARREVQEELGLTVDKLVAEGTYWFGKGQMLMHGFLGFARKQVPSVQRGEFGPLGAHSEAAEDGVSGNTGECDLSVVAEAEGNQRDTGIGIHHQSLGQGPTALVKGGYPCYRTFVVACQLDGFHRNNRLKATGIKKRSSALHDYPPFSRAGDHCALAHGWRVLYFEQFIILLFISFMYTVFLSSYFVDFSCRQFIIKISFFQSIMFTEIIILLRNGSCICTRGGVYMMSGTQSQPKKSLMDCFLNWIERAGNKLPDPVSLFVLLSIVVLILSAILGSAGVSAVHPGTGKEIKIVNLLSVSGFRMMWSKAVSNFANFAPAGHGPGVCHRFRRG